MKLKKAVFLLAAGILLFCASLPAYAEEAQSKGLESYFRTGDHKPYISGYGNHIIAPDKEITRSEAAQMLCNLLLYPPETAESRFSDVTPGEWYADAVNSLSQIGIFNGYGDGTFRPGQNITRAEYVKALTSCVPAVEADNPFSDVKSTHWAYRNILTAISKQWINGYEDGTFRPDQTITRAEAVTILNRALKRTGAGFAEYRTGEYFTDIGKGHWAYLDIVEASGAVAYEEADLPPVDTDAYVRVTASSGLNLREGPGSGFGSILVLSNHTVLSVLSVQDRPWIYVQTSGGVKGYVHSDYIEEYRPNTDPAENIRLSAQEAAVPQYKTFRLDGVSSPRTSIRWSSEDDTVAAVSSVIAYGEGDESCFVIGKTPGTTVITCTDYTGKVQARCSVTVGAPEPVRFAYCDNNTAAAGETANLVALTDSSKDSVKFIVSGGVQQTALESDSYRTEQRGGNTVRIFQCPIRFSGNGEYRVQVYSAEKNEPYTEGESFSVPVGTAEPKDSTTYGNRQTSNAMIELIMDYEDYVPVIRDDSAAPKHPTVGYGFVVNTNTAFYDSLTRTEARAMLVETINSYYGEAVNQFRSEHQLKMSQSQFDALVSFNYNLGTAYMEYPSGRYLFETILNAVIPPSGISAANPCSATLNVKDADLLETPNKSSKVVRKIQVNSKVQVTAVKRDAQTKETWYLVKAGKDTGWMRAGNIHLDIPSPVRDLNYVDSMTFATYLLAYHHTDVCEPGLLYRRLREAKLFNHGDYAQASPSNPYSTKNTYGYLYPDCMKAYE